MNNIVSMIYKCERCIEIFFTKDKYDSHKHSDEKKLNDLTLAEMYKKYEDNKLSVPRYKSGKHKGELISNLKTLVSRFTRMIENKK